MSKIFSSAIFMFMFFSFSDANEFSYLIEPTFQDFELTSKVYISEVSTSGLAWSEDYYSHQRILEIDIDNGSAVSVVDIDFGSGEFSSSPDQKYFLLSGSYTYNEKPYFVLYDRKEGKIISKWDQRFVMPVWSPDSRYVSFIAGFIGPSSSWKVVLYDTKENLIADIEYELDGLEFLHFQRWSDECSCFVFARSPEPKSYDPLTGLLLNYYEDVEYFTIEGDAWKVTDVNISVISSPSRTHVFRFYSDENGVETRVSESSSTVGMTLSLPFGIAVPSFWSKDEKFVRFINVGEIDFGNNTYKIQDKEIKTLVYNVNHSLVYSYEKDNFNVVNTMTLDSLKTFEPFWRD